jgi:NAD(P)-dependent dehydrogenase (short-subunit alcohol dehydrogenase family)
MSAHDDAEKLDGKVAVVTGAGGVGSAVGELLIRHGARVVFWDIDPDAILDCTSRLSAQYGQKRVFGLTVDVRDRAAVAGAATESAQWGEGRVDILAMCHGVLKTARLLELTERDWDEVVNTNAKGRFLASQAVARQMIATGTGGVIIDVGSFTGERIAVGRLHYCAGNAVGEALTRAMAVDLGQYGIRVVSVSSGPIDTPLLGDRARDPQRMSRFLEHIPLGRLGLPADVAEIVAFVASDEGRYWTGGSVALDGGWMAG